LVALILAVERQGHNSYPSGGCSRLTMAEPGVEEIPPPPRPPEHELRDRAHAAKLRHKAAKARVRAHDLKERAMRLEERANDLEMKADQLDGITRAPPPTPLDE